MRDSKKQEFVTLSTTEYVAATHAAICLHHLIPEVFGTSEDPTMADIRYRVGKSSRLATSGYIKLIGSS
jgi:hypothetical protein